MEKQNKFEFQDTKATRRIFELRKRIRVVCGGTSASKTISILVWIIDYCQTRDNKKVDVISESIPHLDDGAIRDFKGIMTDRGYWDDNKWNSTLRIYDFGRGTYLKFKSVDKLGKSRGPRRDVLFLNEADNIPYDIADQLMVRTKDVIWIDYNPTYEFWVYTELIPNRDHDFLTLTYTDCVDVNTNKSVLADSIIQDIESHKGNKEWWKVYGLGQLGEIEGRIYTGWRLIDEIPHEARLERYGLDFGYTNDPTAIVAIYYYNGGWILDELIYQRGMSNRDIANIFNNLPENEKKLVVADNAEPKSIDEIKSYGISIMPCNKGKDSVRNGIQLIQDQPISITKRSLNGIKEYRNYMWMKDKNGEYIRPNQPAGGNDHFLDAIRYALETLGRLEQESTYWDRVFKDELDPDSNRIKINKEI